MGATHARIGWVRPGTDGVRFLPPDEYTQVVTTRFDLSGVDSVFVEALLGVGSPYRSQVVRFDQLELECF